MSPVEKILVGLVVWTLASVAVGLLLAKMIAVGSRGDDADSSDAIKVSYTLGEGLYEDRCRPRFENGGFFTGSPIRPGEVPVILHGGLDLPVDDPPLASAPKPEAHEGVPEAVNQEMRTGLVGKHVVAWKSESGNTMATTTEVFRRIKAHPVIEALAPQQHGKAAGVPDGWQITRNEVGGIRVEDKDGSWLSMPATIPQSRHTPLEMRLLYQLAESLLDPHSQTCADAAIIGSESRGSGPGATPA